MECQRDCESDSETVTDRMSDRVTDVRHARGWGSVGVRVVVCLFERDGM
jgi:hypothetical protein